MRASPRRCNPIFTETELKRLAGVLRPLEVQRMPLDKPPPRETRFGSPLELSRVHWVRLEVVVEVTYLTGQRAAFCARSRIGAAGGQAGEASGEVDSLGMSNAFDDLLAGAI